MTTNTKKLDNIQLETGNWAKQAHGAVVYRCGKMVLLATVCAQKEAKENQSFFPLTVDYREKFYAAGKIPGGYFKRENRPAEHETLMSRLIDRPCRPLFPEGYFCEVQLLITLLSYDPEHSVEGHAITAASSVLMASDIPWAGPIAGVLIGRIDGKFIADPSKKLLEKSDIELLVAGSKDAITMIEGHSNEYTNKEMIEALDFAHKSIQNKLKLQESFASSLNIKKREVSLRLPDKSFVQEIHDYTLPKMKEANETKDKASREEKVNSVYKEAEEYFVEKLSQDTSLSTEEKEKKLAFLKEEIHTVECLAVRSLIFDKGIRADGRKSEEIRDISIEMDPLPNAHASAIFTRGQTQSLGVLTLGTKLDNQRYETLEGQKESSFMLHYNFPPFSTGEARRMMGPGRREIGHGNLALRALKPVIPDKESFPYVIRIVSEILESNGSSSMASVCSGSLAMMAGGVPIRGAVAGIAMGLMNDENGKYSILSDIAGLEDHFGDMDLKVAGTERGITAFQLDLKVNGIDLKVLSVALEQAEKGRLHILKEMNKACSKTRDHIPEGAPRIKNIQIDPSRIGEMIGPGGRVIRNIMEKSGAEVNVEDDGLVTIASNSEKANLSASKMIEDLFHEVEKGEEYEGVAKRIVDFGVFVELLPGKEGLLHISKISNQRIESVEGVFQEGDKIPVVVLGIDKVGRIDLRHKDYEITQADTEKSQNRNDRNDRGRHGNRSHHKGDRNDRNRSSSRNSSYKGGGSRRHKSDKWS